MTNTITDSAPMRITVTITESGSGQVRTAREADFSKYSDRKWFDKAVWFAIKNRLSVSVIPA